MKQYPAVLRERLLRFVDAGHSHAEAVRTFGVSLRSITRWRSQQAATGNLASQPRPGRTGSFRPTSASRNSSASTLAVCSAPRIACSR